MDELVFMHVPKTGGISVATAMVAALGSTEIVERSVNRIMYLSRVRRRLLFTIIGHECRVPGAVSLQQHLASTPHSHYVVTIVRDPLDRLLSAFCHLNRGGLNSLDLADAHSLVLPYRGDFRAFVKERFRPERCEHTCQQVHFRRQRDWLHSSAGSLLVDYIGRYETFSRDVSRLVALVGGQMRTCPILNHTDHQYYTSEYDRESREIAIRAYQSDCDMLGYRTGRDLEV